MPTADAEDRRRARLLLDRNVVVEAGAGTGKTTLLTDRLLFLLLGGRGGKPVPVERIVALTFTEKAAGEIKLRLTERLAEIGAALGGAARPAARALATIAELEREFGRTPEQVLSSAREALERLDRAQIGTIHGFAARLLRLYPVESGVDPAFRVDEGPLFDELFESEWAAWLDVELGERAPRAAEWLALLKLASLDELEALARVLARETLDLAQVGLPGPGIAQELEALAKSVERLPEGRPKPKGNSRIVESIEACGKRLRALAAAARAERADAPENLAEAELRESSWPKAWDEDGHEVYERAFSVASEASPASEALLRRACALALPFARAFRASYARAGLVSFDGLLRRARDLVRDRSDARAALKAGIETLLIDEFQDTDPLQGELLMFLAERADGKAARWEEVKLGAGRLFVVGDPKQSIYRFRGADISAYESFVALAVREGARSCALTANFRSEARLIEVVNAGFSTLMRREPGLQPAYNPLTAAGAAAKPSGETPVSLAVVGDGPDGKAPDSASSLRAESAWICSWILDHAGEGKDLRLRDVAILMRSAAGLSPLLDALKAAAIPYAVDMERYFYGAQEIIDLTNLLRVLDRPEDRLALCGLLRSPLVALEDAALYRLSRSGGLDYERSQPKDERVAALYGVLRELRARVGREPVGAIVAAALERLPFLELAAGAYHGQQTVSNLQKFARLASAASDERGLTLKELVARLARAAEDPRSEGESPLADEHLEAVRVMTVHKSKGLEFPAVILANASTGRSGAGKRRDALIDWSSGRAGLRLPSGACDATMAWLKALEDEREDRETIRLLYVALTRAKRRLIVTGRGKADAGALSSRLAAAGLWPKDGKDASVPVAAIAPESSARTRRLPAPPAPKLDAKALARAWKRRLALRDEALAKSWTTSPTSALGEPEKRAPFDEPRPKGAAEPALLGELCHRALERWDFKDQAGLSAALAASARSLSRLRPDADWAATTAEAGEILSAFAKSKAAAALRRAEILGREVPFVYGRDGTVVRGSIDLLCRRDGKLVVIDYKTDQISAKDAPARREHYAPQGLAYCEAVRRAYGEDAAFEIVFLRGPHA